VARSIAHVQLDIERGSDPIQGRIAEPGGQGRSFSGWIELVQEIEDARMGTSSGSDLLNREGGKD
jgi:hypothetical protein